MAPLVTFRQSLPSSSMAGLVRRR